MHREVDSLCDDVVVTEDEVQVNKEENLETHERNLQLLDRPSLDKWIVELNQFLNSLILENLILVSICKFPEEFVSQRFIIVID